MIWKPNRLQAIALGAYAVCIVGMVLFPPFQTAYLRGAYTTAGYHFILSPPAGFATVDVGLLAAQMVAATVLAAVAIILAGLIDR